MLVVQELRHRRYFEDSQDIKKRKIKEARRRVKMERMAKGRKGGFNNGPRAPAKAPAQAPPAPAAAAP